MTGERNLIFRRNLRLRGVFTLACAGLLAAMAGCSDDIEDDIVDSGADAALIGDAAKPDAAKSDAASDAGTKDGSVKTDAEADVKTMDVATAETSLSDVQTVDVSTSDVSAVEAGAPDTGADGGTTDAVVDQAASDGSSSEAAPVVEAGAPEAATEAGTDATPDAHMDAAPDAGPDVATADAAPDGAVAPSGLHMCAMLDTDWGIGPTSNQCLDTTTGACSDRASNWVSDIGIAFSGQLGNDCRIADMFNAQGFSSSDYGNELAAWTLQFFGCPDPDLSSGPLTFGLIPSALDTHVFTTADLKALSDLYVDGVIDALANPFSGVEAPLTPLTSQQIADIRANLAALAAATPGIQTSNVYSFGSCAADAGTDAHD